MTMDRLPAPDSSSKLHRPASGRIARPASARAARLGSAAGRRATHAAVTGANALPRLLSAAERAQRPAVTGADRSQIMLGQRDTLVRWLLSVPAAPGSIGGASASGIWRAPPVRPAGEDDLAAQRAPWRRAQNQHAALAALAAGRADRGQRDFLIEEIRRQVPDVSYLAQSTAGARTVLSLIIPGNRALGLKTLNDHVVGYQINNSMIGPQRNQAVKNAFLGVRDQPAGSSPFTVAEQTYKLTTVTSPRVPRQLGAPLSGALQTIDRDVPPVYQHGLEYGLHHWRAVHERAPDASPDRTEAARRVVNIENALALVKAPGFQLDFQFGLAEIHRGAGGGPSSYAAALAAHMQSSQAALMRRDPGVELAPGADTDVGDPRGQIYDREAFLRFCKRGEALRQQVIERGNTLTHHGHAYRVFADPKASREANFDVLRDVRKEKIQADDLPAGQAETLGLFERYFAHANVFDSIRPFTSAEAAPVSTQIKRAQRLIDRLQGEKPVNAAAVTRILHSHPAASKIVPTIDTAAEAVFYNAERTRTHRIILSCDVRDMGVDVVRHYAHAMHRVGRAHENPDRVALQASDRVIEFRRRAIARTRKGYGELVAQAIDDARRRGKHALARELEAEHQPSLLMGGDEITLSVHAGMRPYLPRLAAVLTDPDVARARVAISTTGSDRRAAVQDHIVAQQRADPAHSVLKDFEAALRDLERVMDATRDAESKDGAAAWLLASGLGRLYAENEGDGIVLRRNDTGEIVNPDELRRGIAEMRQLLGGAATAS
jgi:hypothetical protein